MLAWLGIICINSSEQSCLFDVVVIRIMFSLWSNWYETQIALGQTMVTLNSGSSLSLRKYGTVVELV